MRPDKHTVGSIGDIMTDASTGKQYRLKNIYFLDTYGESEDETTYEWVELDDNAYALLQGIEFHKDGIGPLVDVAETYFNVAYDPDDQLLYESKRGLFNSQVTDDTGIKAIVCSQFSSACIKGITYENSRYVGTENKQLSWGFVSDGSGVYSYTDWDQYNDYMTACEQAKYFESRGDLKTFDVNRNGLKAGDLLFYTQDDADESIYYKKITHIAICLGADKDRYIMMHSTDNYLRTIDQKEAGLLVATYRYSTKAPDYFVHSPISAEYKCKKLLEKTLSRSGEYTSNSAFIGEFVFGEPLQRGFYTLQFDDLGDSLGYIVVTYKKGEETITVNYNAIKNTNINNVVFYAEMPITQIYMRVANGTKYDCSWAKLYKGYHA